LNKRCDILITIKKEQAILMKTTIIGYKTVSSVSKIKMVLNRMSEFISKELRYENS